MVKFILIKSPDEWATTKQACRDELVVYNYLSFSFIYIYIYIYIAEVLKTRSNLAAKFKVQLLPKAAIALTVSFKFLGGAASWLVACKSNKYEVLVHSQNKSLDLSMGG